MVENDEAKSEVSDQAKSTVTTVSAGIDSEKEPGEIENVAQDSSGDRAASPDDLSSSDATENGNLDSENSILEEVSSNADEPNSALAKGAEEVKSELDPEGGPGLPDGGYTGTADLNTAGDDSAEVTENDLVKLGDVAEDIVAKAEEDTGKYKHISDAVYVFMIVVHGLVERYELDDFTNPDTPTLNMDDVFLALAEFYRSQVNVPTRAGLTLLEHKFNVNCLRQRH